MRRFPPSPCTATRRCRRASRIFLTSIRTRRKGGRLNLAFLGAFDSLNPYNVKALSTAQGLVGNVYQSLMIRSDDEPFTLYGLIAESIETDPARDRIVFHLNPAARFSDGSPITAADVLFSFRPPQGQGTASAARRLQPGEERRRARSANGAVRSRGRRRPRAAADPRHHAGVVPRPYRRRAFRGPDAADPGRLGPVPRRRGRSRRTARAQAQSRLLGARPARLEGPVQFRRDPHRLLPRRDGDVRGVQGRADRLPGRGRRDALALRIRLPRRARRPDRQGRHSRRPAERRIGLRLQHPPPDVRRRPRARGAGLDVRLRMDQRQSLRRRLQALGRLFRRQRTLVDRASRLRAGEGPALSVPANGQRPT